MASSENLPTIYFIPIFYMHLVVSSTIMFIRLIKVYGIFAIHCGSKELITENVYFCMYITGKQVWLFQPLSWLAQLQVNLFYIFCCWNVVVHND